MKILYILMFLSLWSLGLFILFNRTRSNVWIGLTILLGGGASFAFAMHLSIMPFLGTDWIPAELNHLLYQLTVIAMQVHFYILPYVFCMGGMWLNERLEIKFKRLLTIVLLAGPVALLADHYISEPWNVFDISRFRWWDGIYIVLGCIFYLLAHSRERSELNHKTRWRIFIFPLVMVWAYVSDYIGFDYLELNRWSLQLQSNGMWQANFIVILGTVGVVLFYIARYGFLGIKLRIERERIDYSIRTLTMGVSILNHSIKNEIQKIDYLAEKSRSQILSGQPDKAVSTIEQVHGLTGHLLMMVNRIKEKAEDVTLDEGEQDIRQLIDSVLASAATLTENRAVTLSSEYQVEGLLRCDAVHVKETLSNLIRNSLDALPIEGGSIEIKTSGNRREFQIEVRDNGEGIPRENITRVFEPFFTTKKQTLNYGLGLSYCVSVMSKHGGKLTVAESEPGKGTSIVLHFPAAKFKTAVSHSQLTMGNRELDHPSPS